MRLSLVSGRPISFVSQLYAPRYVSRPSAELPEDAAARPVLHAGGYAEGSMSGVGPGSGGGIGSGHGGGVMGGIAGAPAPPPPAKAMRASPRAFDSSLEQRVSVAEEAEVINTAQPMASPSSIVAGASADAVGELFEYRIAQPVTIRKNESAMLPFLQEALDARKLLIWSDHSLRASHQRRRADQFDRQGPGWRPGHGV